MWVTKRLNFTLVKKLRGKKTKNIHFCVTFLAVKETVKFSMCHCEMVHKNRVLVI